MTVNAVITVHAGEPIEAALKRLRRKLERERFPRDFRRHQAARSPGERERIKRHHAAKRMKARRGAEE